MPPLGTSAAAIDTMKWQTKQQALHAALSNVSWCVCLAWQGRGTGGGLLCVVHASALAGSHQAKPVHEDADWDTERATTQRTMRKGWVSGHSVLGHLHISDNEPPLLPPNSQGGTFVHLHESTQAVPPSRRPAPFSYLSGVGASISKPMGLFCMSGNTAAAPHTHPSLCWLGQAQPTPLSHRNFILLLM